MTLISHNRNILKAIRDNIDSVGGGENGESLELVTRVINIDQGDTKLTVDELDNIHDVTFFQMIDGKPTQIDLQYSATANAIHICSNLNIMNVTLRIEGI